MSILKPRDPARTDALASENRAGSPSLRESDKKIQLGILAIACLMFLPALGSTGILNTTDSYYTEAAREMIERRDFIIPYLNYSPYYFKPILTYWLIIASYLTFGVSTFASRLPSALCCIGTVLAIYSLTRNFIGRRAALLAALALASMPLFVVVGHISLTDTPLVFLSTVANLLLLGALVRGTSWGLVPAYICLGLAVLCKGPLAIAFVAIAIGGFLLVTSQSLGDFTRRFFSLKPLMGIAILLAVALPWYVAAHIASHGAFTEVFFIQQNFGRLSGQFQSHNNPVWFYVPYLICGFIPWLPLLLSAPVVLRPGKEKRFSRSPRVQVTIASCCWLLGTLALLMASSSKVAHYLLPLAAPIAILTGLYFDALLRLERKRFIFWVAPTMIVGGIGCLILFGRLFDDAPDLRMIASVFVSLLIVGYTAYGAAVLKSQYRTGVVLLFTWSLLDSGLMVPISLQQTYRQGNEGFEYVTKQATQLNATSIAVRSNECATATFYTGKKIFEIDSPFDCTTFLSSTEGPHYFIFDSKTLKLLQPFIPGSQKVICTKGKWNLLKVDSEKPKVSTSSTSKNQ